MDEKSNFLWIVGFYLFSTVGELCLIPVILLFANNMAPKRLAGTAQGLVLVVIGLSEYFATQFGALSKGFGEFALFSIASSFLIVFGLLAMLFNHKIVALTRNTEKKK